MYEVTLSANVQDEVPLRQGLQVLSKGVVECLASASAAKDEQYLFV